MFFFILPWDLLAASVDHYEILPHVIGSGFSFVNWLPKFRTNDVQNTPRLWRTLDFDREYLQSGSRYRQSVNCVINCSPFPRVVKKNVNFGPLTRKLQMCILTDTSQLFPKTIFGPYGMLPHHFFTCATEWPWLANTHHTWGGDPRQFVTMKI